MTVNKYKLNKYGTKLLDDNRPLFDWANEADYIVDLLNEQDKVNQQLKEQIKVYEKFLDENNLNIEWDLFCTAHVCDEEEIECRDCKYMRWVDD